MTDDPTTEVTTFPVLFTSNGVPLTGRVHRRAGRSGPAERQPAVVVTGSWLTVKEQMPDRYAGELAARGFTALTFDFSGWGQSGGDLRHAELPSRKIDDIAAAAAFLRTQSFVRPGGVGHVGICATAQYALASIALGAPIRSFAAVAGWFHDTTTVAPFYGGPSGVEARLERGQEAFDSYLRDGKIATVPAYAPGDDRAGMSIELDYYSDPGRGAVPEWPNEMAELSWLPWLSFDGLSAASSVEVPTLLVHSDGCVFPENVDRLRHDLRGPVEVAWGDGTQIDFYDRDEQVRFAVDSLARHFAATLTGPREASS